MSAATILFTDVEGFSRRPTAEQRRLIEGLTREVEHEVRSLLRPALGSPAVIALPTGDGMALAFLHEAEPRWNRATLLSLVLRLLRWAHGSGMRLRVGLHVGAVQLVNDINGRSNVCGDTINYAQRVMDAANGQQVLFSEEAFREYIGPPDTVLDGAPLPDGVKARFRGPFEVFAKHRVQIPVYAMVPEPQQSFWVDADPVAKHLMAVALTPLPKTIVPPAETGSSFGERVARAERVALIQLTGERLLELLERGLDGGAEGIRLSPSLRRFWVFMPHPDTYRGLRLGTTYAAPESVEKMANRWRQFFVALGKRLPQVDTKIGLFHQPPFLGASFLDWDRPGGRIHVSPYVWGVPAQECPGYDLEWLGQRPSAIYETYVRGLEYLNAHALAPEG